MYNTITLQYLHIPLHLCITYMYIIFPEAEICASPIIMREIASWFSSFPIPISHFMPAQAFPLSFGLGLPVAWFDLTQIARHRKLSRTNHNVVSLVPRSFHNTRPIKQYNKTSHVLPTTSGIYWRTDFSTTSNLSLRYRYKLVVSRWCYIMSSSSFRIKRMSSWRDRDKLGRPGFRPGKMSCRNRRKVWNVWLYFLEKRDKHVSFIPWHLCAMLPHTNTCTSTIMVIHDCIFRVNQGGLHYIYTVYRLPSYKIHLTTLHTCTCLNQLQGAASTLRGNGNQGQGSIHVMPAPHVSLITTTDA